AHRPSASFPPRGPASQDRRDQGSGPARRHAPVRPDPRNIGMLAAEACRAHTGSAHTGRAPAGRPRGRQTSPSSIHTDLWEDARRIALTALAGVVSAARTTATEWNGSSVRLLAPVAAGGANDPASRLIAERVEKAFKRPVVVENR